MEVECRRGRLVAGLAAAGVLALGLSYATMLPARATGSPSLGTVDQAHQVMRWQGGPFTGQTLVSVPAPTACAYNCEEHSFAINLPAASWAAKDAGVLVSIRYPSVSDSLALYVYDPSGSLVGQSYGIDTNGQGVYLTHPANGTYQITVSETYAQDASFSYTGELRYEPTLTPPCGMAACDMLPRLAPAPPAHITLTGIPPIPSTEAGTPFAYAGPGSCYLDEQTAGAHRCLRFTQDIRNIGQGPLELRFRFIGANGGVPSTALTECQMEQVVHRTDGSTWTRPAGPCVFHVQHQHFHYQNMALNTLHVVRADGTEDPIALRRSTKLGFCLEDVDNFAFGSYPNSPPGYAIPNNVRCEPTGTPSPTAPQEGVWENMGITPGWGDVYTWDLPSQFIEVSGVPDGVYDVVNESNPDGGVLETARPSRSSYTRICMQGDSVKELRPDAVDCSGQVVRAVAAGSSAPPPSAAETEAIATPDTGAAPPPSPLGPATLLGIGIAAVVGARRRRTTPAPD
jgi:hypothetical protein